MGLSVFSREICTCATVGKSVPCGENPIFVCGGNIHHTMVYAGIRDAQRDIPDPPSAQSPPDQHHEENLDAIPDQEEMEQTTN